MIGTTQRQRQATLFNLIAGRLRRTEGSIGLKVRTHCAAGRRSVHSAASRALPRGSEKISRQ